ncbi:MAG: hypothetical protein ACRCZP_09585, partial [Phycicoccus sp.]
MSLSPRHFATGPAWAAQEGARGDPTEVPADIEQHRRRCGDLPVGRSGSRSRTARQEAGGDEERTAHESNREQ